MDVELVWCFKMEAKSIPTQAPPGILLIIAVQRVLLYPEHIMAHTQLNR